MNYFIKKVLTLIITLFLVSLLAFLAFQVISDPAAAILGTKATPESIAELRHQLGLDRPLPVQYLDWIVSALRFDFGTSYSYKLPVSGMVLQKLPVTAGITFISFLLMLFFSFLFGLISVHHAGGIVDRVLTVSGQICMSVPAFIIGVAFTYIFGIVLRFFTPGQFIRFADDSVKSFIGLFFPALAIAVPRTAMTVKMLKASVLNQMNNDYVRTAYSRGDSTDGVLKRHVLRNAVIPVITFIASSMAEIVANCILVEQVFALPGIGVLLLASIGSRDFPVVQAIAVLLGCWVIVVNFIADLLYQLADPRIRLG